MSGADELEAWLMDNFAVPTHIVVTPDVIVETASCPDSQGLAMPSHERTAHSHTNVPVARHTSDTQALWDWYHGASPRPMAFTETITTGSAPTEVVSFTIPERITRPLEEAERLALRSVEAMMARIAERDEARAVIDPASPKRRVSAFWPNP